MVIRAVIREDLTELEAEKASKIISKPREECKMVLDAVIEDRRNHKRSPRESAPKGGICLRAAERKHEIPNRTFSRWADEYPDYIPTLKRTANERYVDEAKLVRIVVAYNSLSGRKTIKKAIAAL